MKYIRTKDGRLLKVRLEYHELPLAENTIVYWTEIGEPFINKQNNFKLSNTIEELCDEFVIKAYCSNEPFLFMKEQMGIKDFIKKCDKDTIIYGAIWTDKGLIYVAKMNNKGELELL